MQLSYVDFHLLRSGPRVFLTFGLQSLKRKDHGFVYVLYRANTLMVLQLTVHNNDSVSQQQYHNASHIQISREGIWQHKAPGSCQLKDRKQDCIGAAVCALMQTSTETMLQSHNKIMKVVLSIISY